MMFKIEFSQQINLSSAAQVRQVWANEYIFEVQFDVFNKFWYSLSVLKILREIIAVGRSKGCSSWSVEGVYLPYCADERF